MDGTELIKRIKRIFDGYISARKSFVLILFAILALLYLGPSVFRILFGRQHLESLPDAASRSIAIRLEKFQPDADTLDLHIIHMPLLLEEPNFMPFIGNGYFGLGVDAESFLQIKYGRSLSLAVNYRPITLVSPEAGLNVKEALVTEYKNGIVHRLQAWEQPTGAPVEATYQVYAHRTSPSLLFQDIKIVNPTGEDIIVETERMGLGNWPSASTDFIRLHHGDSEHEYVVISGYVDVPNFKDVVHVSIVTLRVPASLQVKSKMSTTLHIVTSVNYSAPIPRSEVGSIGDITRASAVESLKKAVMGNLKRFRMDHQQVWNKLWMSGFAISHSKAENALNGATINATIYDVLSQSRAPLHEETTTPEECSSIMQDLSYADGCYGGHPTLAADKLWSTLHSIENINQVVNYWMVTLEKQSCYQLLRAGADGIIQAMILSFGGMRFKNQHLEMNAHPQDLHRDYHFRRISYGNATHLNITILVQDEDYKAVIYAALDRSYKSYYACDAGCLDPPVQLSTRQAMFPVKLTSPVTAILYITSDKLHMEELKDSIHVKEIAIAPAHEHQVISMHKHGHKWGGLPAIFWFTIVFLIVIFHLFLFRLVVNEYCADAKVRYRKFSDF